MKAGFTLLLGAASLCAAAPSSSTPTDLRCEYRRNPLGIDETRPRLSWVLEPREPKARGQRQTAYQILAASSPARLQTGHGDLWDSGKVASDQSVHVIYAGKALASGSPVWWKVRIWDEHGQASAWSEPAFWSMGLLAPGDWKAKWIGRDEKEVPRTPEGKAKPLIKPPEPGSPEARTLVARMLRKEFQVTGPVRRATAYVCGLGMFELYLNGRKVSEDVLSPALSDYDKRVYYLTYDVTSLVRAGRNAVGAMLGNGRYYSPRLDAPVKTRTYGYPKLLFQMVVEHGDARREYVASDETWKLTTEGPICANNEYDGEEYDARREMEGWNRTGFDDRSWGPAQVVSASAGVLAAQMIEPIRVAETLRPLSVRQLKPGVWIVDLGQNLVGWCRLKVSGPRGTQVTLRHAETLKPDGTLYVDNLRSAAATDRYTLKGTGVEVYEPRFAFHGFRYVEVSGYPGKLTPEAIEGRVVHDALERAGRFQCSNELLNRVYRNIDWGSRGNYRSIPTDCPQRDERQGWLGDRSEESRGETYLYRVPAFYAKWIADIEDSQRADGAVSDVAPAYWAFYNNSVTWPGSFVIIPGHLWEQYADRRVLDKHYPAMRKWVTFMRGFLKDDLMPRDTYGDWCVPPESPKLIHSKDPKRRTAAPVLGTAYFYRVLRLMSRYAEVLGKLGEAREYETLASRLGAAFHARYYRAEQKQYDNGSQTSSILPLAFGMAPQAERAGVFRELVRKIEVETGSHLGTGLVGGQWLMRVLSDNGRPDLAYTLASQKTYPSWGYMLERGATTIWELWNGDTADPAMNSHNHLMLIGDLNIWLHEYLAGIRTDAAQPGFKRIVIRPHALGDLSFVEATHRSLYGEIVSRWRREAGHFMLEVRIPPNTTALVYVPARSPGAVTEAGLPAARAAGVEFLRMEAGTAVFAVQPGSYRFVSASSTP